MEQRSLENINPSQINNFFSKLCVISNRYAKKQHDTALFSKVRKMHLRKVSKLKSKIRVEMATEMELREKIQGLELELQQTRQDRDHALEENKKQIHELNVSLLSIKTRMNEIHDHKKERERRVRELERKIRKKVK